MHDRGDCPDVEMRERLPELLHERLRADERNAVERHVAACPECAAELSILRSVRSSAPVPEMDLDRIVGSLPAYRAATARRHLPSPVALRIAAAVVLVAGIATIRTVARRDGPVRGVDTEAPAPTVATAPPLPAPALTPAVPVLALGVGEPLVDLSDGDLQALADDVGALDAVPITDVDLTEESIIEGDS